jgi:hypothetical protein
MGSILEWWEICDFSKFFIENRGNRKIPTKSNKKKPLHAPEFSFPRKNYPTLT